MAICIYSTVTINQLITNTVAANSKFKTEIAKAQFLKKYEFWGPCNIKSMVRIMVKSLCVVGLVLDNWYLICGQISCLHIATHFHTLTFYRNGVIFEAGWHPPGVHKAKTKQQIRVLFRCHAERSNGKSNNQSTLLRKYSELWDLTVSTRDENASSDE